MCLYPGFVYDAMTEESFDNDTKIVLLTIGDSWNTKCDKYEDVRKHGD
jgi:hypothetical protein